MKKLLPLFLLFNIISASLFMVVESGAYYSSFYNNKYQGYWAALLVEGFLAIAAMLYVGDRKILNICIKIVMIPLFLVVVGGASLKVVSPMMAQLSKAESQKRLVDLLKEQQQQSDAHLALLEGQKVNTVLAIKYQRNISTQLANELKNPTTAPWMIWVVMLFSTFLRFSVQLANLVFAHSLGQIWKNDNSAIKTQMKPESSQMMNSNLQIKHQRVYQYLKKNGGKVTRGQLLASRVLQGGVKEYDQVLARLEKIKKINAERDKTNKSDWIYSIYQ